MTYKVGDYIKIIESEFMPRMYNGKVCRIIKIYSKYEDKRILWRRFDTKKIGWVHFTDYLVIDWRDKIRKLKPDEVMVELL